MPRLIWSPYALDDVQQMYRFLAVKNLDAARRPVTAIRAGVKILQRHPEIGRPVEEMEPEFREWLISFGDSGYVVLFHYDGHKALIVASRHPKEAGYC